MEESKVAEKVCKNCRYLAPMAVRKNSGEKPYFICSKYINETGKIIKVDRFDTCESFCP